MKSRPDWCKWLSELQKPLIDDEEQAMNENEWVKKALSSDLDQDDPALTVNTRNKIQACPFADWRISNAPSVVERGWTSMYQPQPTALPTALGVCAHSRLTVQVHRETAQ